MKMSKLLTKVLFVFLFSELIYGQRIHLHKYRQEDSETKCTHGVVSGDTVVFKTEVDYTEDPTMKHVLIYIKKKTDKLATTKAYNLQKDCNYDGTDCKHNKSQLVEITTKINVTKEYSGARIYGILSTTNSREMESEHHTFPHIYDVSDLNCYLYVNGKEISNRSDCVIKVNVTDVHITYACKGQVAPCLIEISTNDFTKAVQGNDVAIFSTRLYKTNDIPITFKHGACRLDKNVITRRCILKTDANPSTEQSACTNPDIKHSDNSALYLMIILSNTLSCGALFVLMIFAKPYIKSYLRKKKLGQKYISSASAPIKQNEKFSPRVNNSEPNNLFKGDAMDQPQTSNFSDKNKFLKDYKCDKNPGHTHFYPVNDFTENHIDGICRNKDLFDLIKSISELTVSVLVTFKSQDRPKADRTIDDMSPNFYVSETKGFRLKTGMIIRVCHVSENNRQCCPCQNCKESGVQTHMWRKVLILTSSTVVYDKNEAEKSCFNCFYDSHAKETVTLYGSCIKEQNVDEGWSIVECATCNIDLLNKLDCLIKECSDKMTKVNNAWNEHGHKSSFVCIVSHPHDFPKQVTMGHWKDREVVGKSEGIEHTRYQYTTPTCHGSAGAFVYILGVSDISAKHYHVHLGVRNSGYNYCSTGMERKSQ